MRIAQPFSIRQESTTEDNQQYTEERNHREASLEAAKWLNWISIGAVVISFLALIFLGWNIKQNRDALQIDQRAWVGFTDSSININNVGKPPEVSYTIKNTGHAPAFDVCPSRTVVLIPEPITHDFDWNAMDKRMHTFTDSGQCGMTLLDGEAFERDHGYFNTLPPIAAGDRQKIVEGTLNFIFLGRLTYKDAFGKGHTTTYCRVFTSGYGDLPDRMFQCNLKETAD